MTARRRRRGRGIISMEVAFNAARHGTEGVEGRVYDAGLSLNLLEGGGEGRAAVTASIAVVIGGGVGLLELLL